MPKHSIYGLCDPDSTKVRYVGRTSVGLTYRLAQHVVYAGLNMDSKRPVIQWIRRLAEDRRMPSIVLLTECDESESVKKESEFIAKYSKDHTLLNMTNNGENWTVRKTLTLPADLHARIKYLSQRDDIQAYAVIAEALRLYEAVHGVDYAKP